MKKDKFATKMAYVQDKNLPHPQKVYTGMPVMPVTNSRSASNADNGWQKGAGVLATNDISDKMTKKCKSSVKYESYYYLNDPVQIFTKPHCECLVVLSRLSGGTFVEYQIGRSGGVSLEQGAGSIILNVGHFSFLCLFSLWI